MSRVQGALASLTRKSRADYLYDTKVAAEAVGCIPTKFGEWWYRTERKLKELYKAQPGQFTASIAVLLAEAESERQEEAEQSRVA